MTIVMGIIKIIVAIVLKIQQLGTRQLEGRCSVSAARAEDI